MKAMILSFGRFLAMAAAASAALAAELERGFKSPPPETKPWCYWYWISDNISREGITRDLEAMARVGIGEALIGNIFLEDVPAGQVKVLSEAWWGLVEHAIREGGRVGVSLGMFNSPGWSQSGGPWVNPAQAMRYLVMSETRFRGPGAFTGRLPVPKEPFQDVAVLAFPAPQQDAETLAGHAPRVTSVPAATGTEVLLDGRLDTVLTCPAGAGQGADPWQIDFELPQPATVRTVALTPGEKGWAARCEFQAADSTGVYQTVRTFTFDRSNMEINVGPMPRGPVTVSVPATTSPRFRLRLTNIAGTAGLAEVDLSGAARLEAYVEKQLGKMHPTPLPMWETYLWPTPPEPDSAALTVPSEAVLDLTGRLRPDGALDWTAPAGAWVILRVGMTTTGTRNAPASREGQGLEIDKMNRAAAKAHFDAFIGEVLRRIPGPQRTAFKRVIADSYEMGSQNWTDGFADTFRQRYGYDPTCWLPVLTGRLVGSADQSERFLWDLRRLVADQVATEYVGGLRALCRPYGLQLWLENYGHWGFPAEFLQYGGQSDRIGGEFWVTGDLGSIECRAASSAASLYGKPIVSAEAFTGGPPFQTAPWGLKARGDWAFCEGINHFVLHVYVHQPWEDRVPGVNAWFGTEFNRHNTWFESSRAWIDYLRRCCFLLQQGTRVADVAYFIGEDAPKMTGIQEPPLPPGHDFDYVNAEAILNRFRVKNGRLVLPHGASYRVLVLPNLPTMRPEVLHQLGRLIRDGATVLGSPPSRSPSLAGFPGCDDAVKRIAGGIWGTGPRLGAGERQLGRGRVIWGRSLAEVFAADALAADFASERPLRHTHRVDGRTHLYFVANPVAESVATTAAFRAPGLVPEFWWPVDGRVERPAVYEPVGGVVRLPLVLGPHGSVFVVFREREAGSTPVVGVRRGGVSLMDTDWNPATVLAEPRVGSIANTFAYAVWVNPAADTTLVAETNRGVSGLSEPRNDALFPPHGQSAFGRPDAAGSGLAVGRNGIGVFEHGANYFAPVLVHPAVVSGWTHVAVVYRDARPSLYLNGRLARVGLRSERQVYSARGVAGGGNPFQGELGMIDFADYAPGEAEVAGWMQRMPRPGAQPSASAVELVRAGKTGMTAHVWEAGQYSVIKRGGAALTFEVPTPPQSLELLGPWQVEFQPGRGAPSTATFAVLEDWAQSKDPGIRYYSGKATYRTTFTWAGPVSPRPGRVPVVLDLGRVRDLATVRLNGVDLGTVWLAPWRMDVTRALRAGLNWLEIDVVNPWNNRLVGDAALPAGQRHTFLAADTVGRNAPLRPAGLLGPVKVQAASVLQLQ